MGDIVGRQEFYLSVRIFIGDILEVLSLVISNHQKSCREQ